MEGKQTENKQDSTTVQPPVKPTTVAFRSEIATVTNACVESTRQMLEERGVTFDEYSKQCVIAPYPSSGIGRIIRDIQLSEENLKKYRYERLSEIFPRIM